MCHTLTWHCEGSHICASTKHTASHCVGCPRGTLVHQSTLRGWRYRFGWSWERPARSIFTTERGGEGTGYIRCTRTNSRRGCKDSADHWVSSEHGFPLETYMVALMYVSRGDFRLTCAKSLRSWLFLELLW